MQRMQKIKVVITCGMKEIGKTTVLEQFVHKNVSQDTKFARTIEDIYLTDYQKEDNTTRYLEFYDTAGLNDITTSNNNGNNQVLPRHYLQIADAFIIFYSTSKPSSIDVMKSIKADIDRNKDKKDLPIIMIGNVIDSESKQSKVVQDCADWCEQNNIKHFFCSPFENIQEISTPFNYLGEKLCTSTTKTNALIHLANALK